MSGPVIKTLLCGFVCLVLLSGCSLYSVGPNAYVELPENISTASHKTEFVIRTEAAQSFLLASNPAARPLEVINPPGLAPTGLLSLGFNYSLPEGVEIGLSGGPLDPLIFWRGLSFAVRPSIKVQLVGEAGDQVNSFGSRLAIFSHVAWTHMSTSGNQRELFGNGGYPWKANSDFLGVSGGASYGYRFNRRWLGYFGLAHESFNVDGSIHQDVSATGDYPAADYSFEKTPGTSSTFTLGFLFGVNKRFQMTYSYSLNRWAGLEDRQHFVGIGVSTLNFEKAAPVLEPVNR